MRSIKIIAAATLAIALSTGGAAIAASADDIEGGASSPVTQDINSTPISASDGSPAISSSPASLTAQSAEQPTSETAPPATASSDEPAPSIEQSKPETTEPATTPPAVPTPVYGWWLLPNGGTPDNVTWPQPVTATGGADLQPGECAQIDLYPSQAALDALRADGRLDQGEDYGIAISWSFYCEPAALAPNPHANVIASCGVATPWVSNDLGDAKHRLTASFIVYVDGKFSEALVAAESQVVSGTPVMFAEDSGSHTVTVRTGPAFGDVLLSTVTVTSDCVAPPVVVPPTEEPPTEQPPVVETPVVDTPAAVVEQVAVSKPVADSLALTGVTAEQDARTSAWAVSGMVLAFLGIGLAVAGYIRRRKTEQE